MNQHVQPPEPALPSIDGKPVAYLRFDPDGAPIGPEIPDALIARWRNMLADCGKAQARMHRNYERFFKNQEDAIRALGGLLRNASDIADDLHELSELFHEAVAAEGVEGKLADALRLVHSSMTTIADRVGALKVQGDAARARYHL